MTHDQVVAEIQRRAAVRGALSHYCRSAVRCVGTPGMPDILVAGPYGIAWIEVKTPSCPTLSSDQTRWKYALIAAKQRHYVVGPAELADDRLEEILDIIADRPED